MVISCSTCQNEEKECIWIKYVIYVAWQQFQFYLNLDIFSAKSESTDFQKGQKKSVIATQLCTICALYLL